MRLDCRNARSNARALSRAVSRRTCESRSLQGEAGVGLHGHVKSALFGSEAATARLLRLAQTVAHCFERKPALLRYLMRVRHGAPSVDFADALERELTGAANRPTVRRVGSAGKPGSRQGQPKAAIMRIPPLTSGVAHVVDFDVVADEARHAVAQHVSQLKRVAEVSTTSEEVDGGADCLSIELGGSGVPYAPPLELQQDRRDVSDMLRLYRTVCNREKLRPVPAFMRQLPFRDLQLRRCALDDRDMKGIAATLQAAEHVCELDLSANALGAAAVQALVQPMRVTGTIKALILSDNSLGSSGARALADMLRNTKCLETLVLAVW